jgi:tRNA(adenine34) deaminase
LNQEIDEFFMQEALTEATKSLEYEDVPVGDVIVYNGNIIGRGFNQVERLNDSLAHAEIFAIREAIYNIDYKHLIDCSMYVTLEPCAMCSGAIVLARIKNLYIGADDPKTGASGTLYSITEDSRLNHRCYVTRGVLKDDCSALLKEFFKKLRNKKL